MKVGDIVRYVDGVHGPTNGVIISVDELFQNHNDNILVVSYPIRHAGQFRTCYLTEAELTLQDFFWLRYTALDGSTCYVGPFSFLAEVIRWRERHVPDWRVYPDLDRQVGTRFYIGTEISFRDEAGRDYDEQFDDRTCTPSTFAMFAPGHEWWAP